MDPEVRAELKTKGFRFSDELPGSLRQDVDSLTERVVELERCVEFLTEQIIELKRG